MIKLRKEKHPKQEDIAIILNVKRAFVTDVESATKRAKYNLMHIAKLADHFGLSPKDFLPKEVSL